MSAPDRALVLAAGFGSRLAPLTHRLPKPLIPFRGRPVLRTTLETLRDWGVRDALVNTHHLAAEVIRALVREPVPGLRVSLSYEPVILGTGGPLVRNLGFLPDDRPCWLFNADVAFDLDPAPLIAHHRRHQPMATLWMHSERGPRTVRVDDQQIVTDFRDPAPGSPGTHTFCGLHLLGPEVRQRLEDENLPEAFCSIIELYEKWQQHGARVDGVSVPGAWWADLGTPEQVVDAHQQSGAEDTSWIDPSASVSPRARYEGAVVCAGVRLGPRARIRRALIAPDTHVDGPVERFAVPAADALDAAELRALKRLDWPLDGAWADLLAPRGSDRSFLRLGDGTRRAMMMRWGKERPENDHFARHTDFLAAQGVRVPHLLAGGCAHRFLLMEDLGQTDLLQRVAGRPGHRQRAVYRECLPLIARLHGPLLKAAKRARLPLQPGFDAELYAWEHEYFITHLVRQLPDVGAPLLQQLRQELREVADQLLAEPPVLIHRDLQSTNLLFHQGTPALIDYQGMREGAAAYDLASLLADPYVNLSGRIQAQLLQDYIAAGGAPGVSAAFAAGCIQRLVQALGAYGNLGSRPDTRRFLEYIPAGLTQLEQAVTRWGDRPALQEVITMALVHRFTGANTRVS